MLGDHPACWYEQLTGAPWPGEAPEALLSLEAAE
jgi:hypothetical protein